jgi:tetratricopeptide (TPR) repeat protein
MSDLDDIDRYFRGENSPEEKRQFEDKIADNPEFAEQVTFYLGTLAVSRENARESKRERFRTLYDQGQRSLSPLRRLTNYLAAAAVVAGLVIGVYWLLRAPSRSQLADRYVREQYGRLPVSMGNPADPIQDGLILYNDNQLDEALRRFESILASDSSNFLALKYAGIVSLRLENYDKALGYFEKMESHREYYANPAILLQALTLVRRGGRESEDKAKKLLQTVLQKDLEGKDIATKLLRNW